MANLEAAEKSVKLTLTYINFKTLPQATIASSRCRTAPEFISNHVGGQQMRVSGIFSSPRILLKGGGGGGGHRGGSLGGVLIYKYICLKGGALCF